MKNYYELKQTTLMEMEIEGLVAKIQRLEKELALQAQEIKHLKASLNKQEDFSYIDKFRTLQ